MLVLTKIIYCNTHKNQYWESSHALRGPHVAHGPAVGPHWFIKYHDGLFWMHMNAFVMWLIG